MKVIAELVAALGAPVLHELIHIAERRAAGRDPQHAVEDQLVQHGSARLVRFRIQPDRRVGDASRQQRLLFVVGPAREVRLDY